ncbi:MAG: thiamine-phosphate kinase [Candidatus Aminicenantia bacterium]
MKIKDIGELGFIKWIMENFETPETEGVKGIGDDTAIIRSNSNYLLVTKDLLIEDVHFKLSFHPPYLLGRKSMAVNISDIAAMGGEPLYALLGVGFPSELSLEWIQNFMFGMREICKEFGVFLIGGDTCASSKIFISITLIGKSKEPILRSTAKVGDYIYLTGNVGDSGAGLFILMKNLELEDEHIKYLIKRHLDPSPRVEVGKFLQENSLASSMIDLSDGLSIDLHNLCRESKVGALIYADKIPISEELLKFCKERGEEPLKFALQGGEDYELLFTSSKELDREIIKKLSISLIGRIEEKVKGLRILKDGKEEILLRKGWDHF